MNIEAINKLITHYEQNAPTAWGYSHCVAGMLQQWGLIDSCADAGDYLGLNYDNGYRLLYAINDLSAGENMLTDGYVRSTQSPKHNQANVLGMLRRLVASPDGRVEWKHDYMNAG